ncbi:hypothetical protein SPI_00274 [Niveomyces insectorum RCEF 264]|uniref:Uncharacterized protein n=1 Tax=Niveomyces insectorum RCEF 264 TaxID=1081102 RepID=A0A167ZZU8_9HYPO|nr:hypothetical protein SPI_00274 [Niveomyces insectorum RCEF 264]
MSTVSASGFGPHSVSLRLAPNITTTATATQQQDPIWEGIKLAMDERLTYARQGRAVVLIPPWLYDKAMRWQLQQLKQERKGEERASEAAAEEQGDDDVEEAEPLTEEEKAKLVARGDYVGRVLADAQSLTETERYCMLNWLGPPSHLREHIRLVTGGALSEPHQLMAKARRLIEEAKTTTATGGTVSGVTTDAGQGDKDKTSGVGDGNHGTRPLATMSDDELDFLAWHLNHKYTVDGDTHSLLFAPGLAQALAVVMYIERVDVLTVVAAMDEVHLRGVEKQRAADEAAGAAGAGGTRPMEPGPTIDVLEKVADGMEVLLARWQDEEEVRREGKVYRGDSRSVPLSDDAFVAKLRLRMVVLREYIDQHKHPRPKPTSPTGPGSLFRTVVDDGLRYVPPGHSLVPPGYIAVPEFELEPEFLKSRVRITAGGGPVPVSFWPQKKAKIEGPPRRPEPWNRSEGLRRGKGWPPEVHGQKPILLFWNEREKELEDRGAYVRGGDIYIDEAWTEMPAEEKAVYEERADQMRKEAWRVYLKGIGIEF